MTTSRVNNPEHWRDRAAEMRALARTVQDLEAIAIMNRLADDYDKLADRAGARSNGEVLREGVGCLNHRYLRGPPAEGPKQSSCTSS